MMARRTELGGGVEKSEMPYELGKVLGMPNKTSGIMRSKEHIYL